MSNEFARPDDAPFIPLTIGNDKHEMHAGNTVIYHHTHQEDGDHVFVMHERQDDNKVLATYLWRAAIIAETDLSRYTRMTKVLGEIGCETTVQRHMEEGDLDVFRRRFGWTPPVRHDITDRHHNEIRGFRKNFRILLKQSPSLFWGVMTDPNDMKSHPRRWA